MKFNGFFWWLFTTRMKKGLIKYRSREEVKSLIAKAKPIYKDLLSKVKGVSSANPMGFNITSSFIIVAIWLASDKSLTPDQMSDVMEIMMDWGLLRTFYGSTDMNTSKGIAKYDSNMRKNAEWAANHPEDDNTWDINFDENKHKDGLYFYFTHCPIAEFTKQYGLEEITPVLCNIDYVTAGMVHSRLIRNETLAGGGSMCDYWLVGDKVANPQ